MSSIWGKNIKISIFGESHGPLIGVTIDGIPSGIKLDMGYISKEMKRRKPGRSMTTPRKEDDNVEIVSGIFNGFTTGTPLTATIKNKDINSAHYTDCENIPRPSHADYTGMLRYNNFNDKRGGGHFSGRLTAPIVFAGSILRLALEEHGIVIGSHLKSIQSIEDKSFDMCKEDIPLISLLRNMDLPVIDTDIIKEIENILADVSKSGDSVGGVIEGIVYNLPAGLGDPIFHSIESLLSSIFFSIPGVKGVEFGAGFSIASMQGSLANDAYCNQNGNIRTTTNNNGGIVGGISNGMPIIWRVAMKPTPSISLPQKSLNLETLEPAELSIVGRHDPCIAIRAVPVLEAACAIAIFDILLSHKEFIGIDSKCCNPTE